MKVLYIDSDYYYYPQEVNNFSELGSYLNNNYGKFIKLTRLCCDRTVPPFFIDEFKKDVYVNIADCSTAEEVNVAVMTKEDYKTSLNNAIDEICTACDSFNTEKRCCDCGEIQENMCLNGKCDTFSLADDEDYM